MAGAIGSENTLPSTVGRSSLRAPTLRLEDGGAIPSGPGEVSSETLKLLKNSDTTTEFVKVRNGNGLKFKGADGESAVVSIGLNGFAIIKFEGSRWSAPQMSLTVEEKAVVKERLKYLTIGLREQVMGYEMIGRNAESPEQLQAAIAQRAVPKASFDFSIELAAALARGV